MVFIDEIDSLLTTRKENELEVLLSTSFVMLMVCPSILHSQGTRRLKTEFLLQMDGVMASMSESDLPRVLLLGIQQWKVQAVNAL